MKIVGFIGAIVFIAVVALAVLAVIDILFSAPEEKGAGRKSAARLPTSIHRHLYCIFRRRATASHDVCNSHRRSKKDA